MCKGHLLDFPPAEEVLHRQNRLHSPHNSCLPIPGLEHGMNGFPNHALHHSSFLCCCVISLGEAAEKLREGVCKYCPFNHSDDFSISQTNSRVRQKATHSERVEARWFSIFFFPGISARRQRRGTWFFAPSGGSRGRGSGYNLPFFVLPRSSLHFQLIQGKFIYLIIHFIVIFARDPFRELLAGRT